jgi:hypothetical protein
MADERKQGNQPQREGQRQGTNPERTTDPSQRREGQSGTERESQKPSPTRERGSETGTGTGTGTRNTPEGDVEGIGQSRR